MEDPNSAAAANAVAAGRNFWGNVQQMRENRFTKTRLGIEQQAADVGTAGQKLREQEFQSTLPGIQAQTATAQLGLAQAKKTDFLQSHNPHDSAKPAYIQTAVEDYTKQSKPVTDADVTAQNVQQLGPDLASRLMPNPKAVPGHIQFPMPQDPEDRTAFGVPPDLDQPNWAMPQEKFQAAVQTRAAAQAENDFSKPYDSMSPRAQRAIRESYQKNAPPGVKISDAEAVRAFRLQQSQTRPQVTPASAGLTPFSMVGDPNTPGPFQAQYMSGLGSGEGGANEPFIRVGSEIKQNPEYFSNKEGNEQLQKLISGNKELDTAQQKAIHAANALSYANEPHPTVSSDKSLIMSYLKTIDPTVRVSEGTVTTVMDEMGIPDEIKNFVDKRLSGSLFTPEHRRWFATAAAQNLENARQTANSSIMSQVALARDTGNPVAKNFKLSPNVLPPSQQPGPAHGKGETTSSGSSGSPSTGTSPRVFATSAQADGAGLIPGTTVKVVNPATGRPQSYQIGGVAQ